MITRRIAVLMTSFNRREFTLRALRRLFAQRGVDDVRVTVFLVEDGCTDGTGDAVCAEFTDVRVLHGDGSLYWNRGMRMAFAAALDEGYDAYLLLNDDTMLGEDALRRLVDVSEAQKAAGVTAIVVGSTRSPETGALSYGGICLRRRGLSVTLEKIAPSAEDAIACDTMNGNIVLIPAAIAKTVGNLEERFHHHFGDLDYGLRAGRAGFAVVVAPGYLGECGTNSARGTWRDARLPLKKRWKNLQSPKGQPLAQWVLFTRRHYGWRWPLYACSPYVKTIVSSLLTRRRQSATDAAAQAGN
ncbi:MAG: glycosyltransferase family 2 protein [Terracidiphilus sp.]|nr:glycosyltransferase family 2 protein [Terracidiphilus sp.]